MKEQQFSVSSQYKLNFSEVLQKEHEIFSFPWRYNDALQVSLGSNHPRLSHMLHAVNSPFEVNWVSPIYSSREWNPVYWILN